MSNKDSKEQTQPTSSIEKPNWVNVFTKTENVPFSEFDKPITTNTLIINGELIRNLVINGTPAFDKERSQEIASSDAFSGVLKRLKERGIDLNENPKFKQFLLSGEGIYAKSGEPFIDFLKYVPTQLASESSPVTLRSGDGNPLNLTLEETMEHRTLRFNYPIESRLSDQKIAEITKEQDSTPSFTYPNNFRCIVKFTAKQSITNPENIEITRHVQVFVNSNDPKLAELVKLDKFKIIPGNNATEKLRNIAAEVMKKSSTAAPIESKRKPHTPEEKQSYSALSRINGKSVYRGGFNPNNMEDTEQLINLLKDMKEIVNLPPTKKFTTEQANCLKILLQATQNILSPTSSEERERKIKELINQAEDLASSFPQSTFYGTLADFIGQLPKIIEKNKLASTWGEEVLQVSGIKDQNFAIATTAKSPVNLQLAPNLALKPPLPQQERTRRHRPSLLNKFRFRIIDPSSPLSPISGESASGFKSTKMTSEYLAVVLTTAQTQLNSCFQSTSAESARLFHSIGDNIIYASMNILDNKLLPSLNLLAKIHNQLIFPAQTEKELKENLQGVTDLITNLSEGLDRLDIATNIKQNILQVSEVYRLTAQRFSKEPDQYAKWLQHIAPEAMELKRPATTPSSTSAASVSAPSSSSVSVLDVKKTNTSSSKKLLTSEPKSPIYGYGAGVYYGAHPLGLRKTIASPLHTTMTPPQPATQSQRQIRTAQSQFTEYGDEDEMIVCLK